MNDSPNHNRPAHRAVLWTGVAATFISTFSHLGGVGFLGPDEPRYAWIARAMAASGDWVTPRLYGQPWFEKPILYYWAAAVGFWLRLPPEWAARMTSALAAMATALAIGWLAWKHYGAEGATLEDPVFLAPVIFATSVAAVGFARAATPDMLFSASLALAMASAATVLRRGGSLRGSAGFSSDGGRTDWQPLVSFGACLGLAVLAKGPAGVLLAGGAILLWALATKRWQAALRFIHPMAILPFCVVALPWYVICASRNPEFLRVFILEHNFERYLTPAFHHPQPFWFFVPITLLALLPWTALLWPALAEAFRLWRAKSWADSPGLFFGCWAIFPIVFFSFSQSKLPSYILPAIAPLAILCAVGASRAFRGAGRLSALLFAAIGATWIALAIAALIFARRIPWANFNPDYTPGFVAVCGVIVVGMFALFAVGITLVASARRPHLAVASCAACVALVVAAGGPLVFPAIDAFYSARHSAEYLRADRRPDRIFTYHLDRGWNFGLAFYFRRVLPEWSPSDPEPALVLTTPEGFRSIRQLGRFTGDLDEPYAGVLYVPIPPAPH